MEPNDDIKTIKARIVKFTRTRPIAPSRLAVAAGLNKNTLANMLADNWSPSAETLHRLLVAIGRLEQAAE